MAIVITRTVSGYEASATPPHVQGSSWRTRCPLTARELISVLLERGAHQTDIADAFHAANPNWLAEMSSQYPGRVQT
jgi:hypothetical protein